MCNPITTEEPHRLLTKGVHEGFEWEVTFNYSGFRCGYVRLPQGHPWHGKDYNDISPDVHGGLSFAEPDLRCGKGGADDAWWIGFDCGHAFDLPDPDLPIEGEHFESWIKSFEDMASRRTPTGYPQMTIKTTEYVEAECRSLCEQAASIAKKES